MPPARETVIIHQNSNTPELPPLPTEDGTYNLRILGGIASWNILSRFSPLANMAVGSIIKLKENGVAQDFYVSAHDYEAALNGSGRTLLVRRNIYGTRQWHTSSVNAYASSAIDTWFNNDYEAMLDADIQNAAGTTKFFYTPGNGNTTVTTLSRKIFALSVTELGRTASYANVEGSALSNASTLQIATNNNDIAVVQWARSPYTLGAGHACVLGAGGNASNGSCTFTNGARPALTLPSSLSVDDNGNIIV